MSHYETQPDAADLETAALHVQHAIDELRHAARLVRGDPARLASMRAIATMMAEERLVILRLSVVAD